MKFMDGKKIYTKKNNEIFTKLICLSCFKMNWGNPMGQTNMLSLLH